MLINLSFQQFLATLIYNPCFPGISTPEKPPKTQEVYCFETGSGLHFKTFRVS